MISYEEQLLDNPEAQATAEGWSGGGEAGTNWSDLLYGE